MPNKQKEPNCKYCYDKGFYTVFRGEIHYADFVGDETPRTPFKVEKVPCSRCKPKEETVAYTGGCRCGECDICKVLDKEEKWEESQHCHTCDKHMPIGYPVICNPCVQREKDKVKDRLKEDMRIQVALYSKISSEATEDLIDIIKNL